VIEQEIVGLRSELGDLLGELDRRRREMLDLRLQARRHAAPAALTALALAAAAAGAVAVSVRRGRRRQAAMAAAGESGRAAAEPTVMARIVGAAGSAAVAVVVKGALEHLRHRLEARAHGGEQQPSAGASRPRGG
jgi:hypothetical protein